MLKSRGNYVAYKIWPKFNIDFLNFPIAGRLSGERGGRHAVTLVFRYFIIK
jgi:hypothetical protein